MKSKKIFVVERGESLTRGTTVWDHKRRIKDLLYRMWKRTDKVKIPLDD